LPDEFEARRGAFFRALMQLRTVGAPVSEATVTFIREVVIPDAAYTRRVFAYRTVRAIVDAAREMMPDTEAGGTQRPQPIGHDAEPRPLTIADMALDDAAAETIEQRWDLRTMRAGKASPSNRREARLRRAFVFQLVESEMDDAAGDVAAKKLRGLGHAFWMKLTAQMTRIDVIKAAEAIKEDGS
jgi:hypothetical protein